MTREELPERIWTNPERCFGKPCLRGHRIWVSSILDLLSNGSSGAGLPESDPNLTAADIQACIADDAEMARERIVQVPLEPAA